MELDSPSSSPSGYRDQASASHLKRADDELQSVEITDQLEGNNKKLFPETPPKIVVCMATEDNSSDPVSANHTELSDDSSYTALEETPTKNSNCDITTSQLNESSSNTFSQDSHAFVESKKPGDIERIVEIDDVTTLKFDHNNDSILFEDLRSDLTELKTRNKETWKPRPDIDSIFSTDDDDSDKSLSIFPEKLYDEDISECDSNQIYHSDSWEELFRPEANDLLDNNSSTLRENSEDQSGQPALFQNNIVIGEGDKSSYPITVEDTRNLGGDTKPGRNDFATPAKEIFADDDSCDKPPCQKCMNFDSDSSSASNDVTAVTCPSHCDSLGAANTCSASDTLSKSKMEKILFVDSDQTAEITTCDCEISEDRRAASVLHLNECDEMLNGITEAYFINGAFVPEVKSACVPAVSMAPSHEEGSCVSVKIKETENTQISVTLKDITQTEAIKSEKLNMELFTGTSEKASDRRSPFGCQARTTDGTLMGTALRPNELANQKWRSTATDSETLLPISCDGTDSSGKTVGNRHTKAEECRSVERSNTVESAHILSKDVSSLSVDGKHEYVEEENSANDVNKEQQSGNSEFAMQTNENYSKIDKCSNHLNNIDIRTEHFYSIKEFHSDSVCIDSSKLCKSLTSKMFSFPCELTLTNLAPAALASVGTSTSEDYFCLNSMQEHKRTKFLNSSEIQHSSPIESELTTKEIFQDLSGDSRSPDREEDDVSTSTEVDSDVTPSRDSIPDMSEISEIHSEGSRCEDLHHNVHGKIMEEDASTNEEMGPEKEETECRKADPLLSPRRKSFWPPTVSVCSKPPESKVRRNKSSPETCPTPSASGVSLTRSHSFIRRNVSSPSLRSLDSASSEITFRSDVARKPSRITSSRSAIHLRRLTERPSEVALLAESALGSLYVPFDTVRTQLVRQAREVLLCRYQGDYWKFRQRFLHPAAALLNELRDRGQQQFLVGSDEKQLPCHTCCSQKWKGWPLNINRRLLIHLGELDTAILKSGDFYLCIQEAGTGVALHLKYWTEKGGVGKRIIHAPHYGSLFAMDWLEGSECPNDENLTSLLQHLLVSVERGIERIEWKSVERPWSCGHAYPGGCCHVAQVDTKDTSVQTSPDGGEMDEEHREEQLETSSKKSSDEDNEDRAIASESFHEDAQRPTCIGQVDQDLLHSSIAVLPGCRDVKGRSVVVIFGSKLSQKVSPCQLAQLLAYYHVVPTREVIRRGFLVLVDGRGASKDAWSALDDTFRLLESIIPNCVSFVLVWRIDDENEATFPKSAVKHEYISSEDKLYVHIKEEQLLVDIGGKYVYDHQEWICFRKFLEPFVSNCRISGRHLVRVMQSLRANQLPSSSSVTHHLIQEQKSHINQTFHDDQLRHLEEEGDTILKELESYGTRSPHNVDYRDCLLKTSNLYKELRMAMRKLSKLADKRLTKLEECLQMKMLEEESSQVLTWLCRKGEEMLGKHQAVADSLGGIKDQEEEFEKFYFVAMRQIEKGNDLLEEAAMIGNEALAEISAAPPPPPDIKCNAGGVQEIATSLKHHLNNFTERLEDTRERLEDTAKCYHLLDKAYEWALEAMRFVSLMRMDNISNPEMLSDLMKILQEYMDEHAAIPEETFQEMIDLATKLGKETLLDQCKVAHAKCQETVELIRTRQSTLQKIKLQLEAETSQQSLWDGDEPSTPRTSRSKSQPGNLWVPQHNNTPFQQIPTSQLFTRRRSVATVSPQPYGSPMGSYTSFPSNYYLIVNHKDNYQLDYFIQEKEHQILTHGLITDDLTTQGPVASIPRTMLEARSIRSSASSGKNSTSGSCSSKTGSLGSSSLNQILVPYHQPIKKYMRRGHTWQMCEEALEKAKTEVREQNEKLKMERLLPGTSGSSNESITSVPESDSRNVDNCSRIPLTHTQSDPLRGPVPVNSHLLTRASSLELQDMSTTDGQLNEDQVKAKKTLMLVMREMIQTERDYVKSLEYTIENYIPELLREDIPQALRGQRNTIFGNIEKIFEFHSQYFLHELEQSENSPFTVGQCFLRYEPQFYLYALYNKNKPKSDALMSEYGTLFFRRKQLELGDKMDLASYLLKPVQRMGKYALLLKQLLKECPERDAEHQDLRAAEEMVRFQLRHGNDLLAMDALRDCDVNVKEQGQLLRQDEFLVWQGRCRKSLRHVFLFEDLILFSKARRDPERKGHEIYQYKHSIKTTDIGMTEQIGDSPTKFEIWFRKRKLNDTYVLQAPTAEIKIAWVQEISKLLWKQALRNREMRLAEMSSMGIGSKPCLDIKPNEDQISNRSIDIRPLNRGHRFRNSIAVASFDQLHNKRPHSIISVSSSSSSGSSQSSFTFYGALNLGFEPGDSPRPLHRSLTQQSQCSTESGFCTDVSLAGDSPPDTDHVRHHKKAERSDSLLSSDSLSLEITGTDFNIVVSDPNTITDANVTECHNIDVK